VKPWADLEADSNVADHKSTVETRKCTVCHAKSGNEKKGRNNQAFWKIPGVPKAGAGLSPDERHGRYRGSTGRGAGAGQRPDTLRGPVIPPEADIITHASASARMSAQSGRARRDVVSLLDSVRFHIGREPPSCRVPVAIPKSEIDIGGPHWQRMSRTTIMCNILGRDLIAILCDAVKVL